MLLEAEGEGGVARCTYLFFSSSGGVCVCEVVGRELICLRHAKHFEHTHGASIFALPLCIILFFSVICLSLCDTVDGDVPSGDITQSWQCHSEFSSCQRCEKAR